MRISIRGKVLLVGACMLAGVGAWGQQTPTPVQSPTQYLEVAVVYNPAMTKAVGGDNFWMQGGSVQVHGQFWHGVGAVADVAGLHTADTGSGVGLDLVSATFGPRYTWAPARRRYSAFGQVLVGEAYGMNSIFPKTTGASDSANSVAVQIGGGVNVSLRHRLAVRAFEAEWLRTQLPNSTTNVQNNLRLGAGLALRFK